MKKSIANKIERLLASMTGTDLSSNASEDQNSKEVTGHPLSAKNIGKFCRRIPISIFNLIRPAQTLDLK